MKYAWSSPQGWFSNLTLSESRSLSTAHGIYNLSLRDLGEMMAERGITVDHTTIHRRHRWGIPTAKINGVAANPPRWPDGTYSVQGAAAAIGVTAQTIFDYLAQGLVHGRQSTKGQPWQISLSSDQIDQLQRRLQRTRRSRKGAS